MITTPWLVDLLFVSDHYTQTTLRIESEGHKWIICSREVGYEPNFEVDVYLNGEWRSDLSRSFGGIVGIAKLQLSTPFPVIAVREHSWCGHGQETWFYGFKGTHMWLIGQPPETGEGGGPILYRGKPGWWLFDNWDHYTMAPVWPEKSPLYRFLYRLGEDGKLKFIRSWKAPSDKRLPDTTRIYF